MDESKAAGHNSFEQLRHDVGGMTPQTAETIPSQHKSQPIASEENNITDIESSEADDNKSSLQNTASENHEPQAIHHMQRYAFKFLGAIWLAKIFWCLKILEKKRKRARF
ncbi:1906_t:CDS:2 [Ambispora gerdemannii]|uniref:1906_t:CDS:1 n=1 Tax=Ambispora gerdemannii TaxID=144530 RepID=A0A9N8VD66_9GLOM|nr:1906_t:CDS:2 [Ambispora gerdemannii]